MIRKAKDQRRCHYIGCRVSSEEKKKLLKVAEKKGISLSSFFRKSMSRWMK